MTTEAQTIAHKLGMVLARTLAFARQEAGDRRAG
jgi:hypothetical protein